MTLFVDFDIKEVVSNLEEFGISTSTHKPCLHDMPLSEDAMAYLELMNIWRDREDKK